MTKRCIWADSSELMQQYHDGEWGRPLHDDRKLFEMLVLEGKSCGLSWAIILKKRDHMRKVFDNFDPEALAKYDEAKINELMQDSRIIRHRAKITAVIDNAKAYFELKQRKSFDNFLWEYVNHQPIVNKTSERITKSEISDRLSKDLKKLGFRFVGSTIIYSFMQAVGMVNDHAIDCFAK
jgi:DNA-3-methyladenine glycosylase I